MTESQPTLFSVLILATVTLAACGGGGGGGSGSDEEEDETADEQPVTDPPGEIAAGEAAHTAAYGIDLSDVDLAARSARSLDRVEVTGLPEGVSTGELYADYEVTEGDILLEPITDPEENPRRLPLVAIDGSTYVLTPLLDPDGSQIVLAITDGGSRSQVLEIELEALPEPRAGSIEELENAMENLLLAATEALGKDYPAEWEHWRDEGVDRMPEHYLPLFRSWHSFFDRENENAWVNRERDADTRELLQRIMAQHPYPQVIQGHAEWIENGESTLNQVDADPTTSATDSTIPVTAAGDTEPNDVWEVSPLTSIEDAPELQEQLDTYQNTRRFETNAELFDETVGTYLSGVALVGSTGLGRTVLSRARRLALERAANVASNFADISEYAQWFLPCCIAELDVDLDPENGEIRYEDMKPNQLSIVDARARAESRPINITEEIFDQIADRVADLVDASLNDAVTELYGEAAAERIDDYGSSAVMDSLLADISVGGEMKFVWEDIDMMVGEPQRWLHAEPDTFAAAGSPIIEQDTSLDDDSYEFRLTAPEAFLRTDSQLRVRPEPDEFGQHAGETKPIELSYIDVEFTPSRITLDNADFESGEGIPFQVKVDHSMLHGDSPFIELPLTIEPEPPIGEIVKGEVDADGTHHFEYQPPADTSELDEDEIVVISTRSTADQGLRHPDNDPPVRAGAMPIGRTPPEVRIAPHFACVDEGETRQFEALDPLTGEPADVSWDVEGGGSIDSDGVLTADRRDAEVTVTASANDSDHADSVTVLLDDCACEWRGRLSSSPRALDGDGGRFAAFGLTFDEDEGVYTGLRIFGEDDTKTALMFDFDTPLPIGESGPTETTAWPASTGSRIQGEEFTLDPPFSPDLTLPALAVEIERRQPLEADHPALGPEEDEAVAMSGEIRGPVAHTGELQIGNDDVRALHIDFSGEFRFQPLGGESQMNCQARE